MLRSDATISWRETATSVSKKTHGIAWRIAGKDGELIPYEAAFLSDEPITEFDIARAHALNQIHGWVVA